MTKKNSIDNLRIKKKKLTIKEYMDKCKNYIKNGSDTKEKHYQMLMREKAIKRKFQELLSSGVSIKEAERQSEIWLKKQAALHNLDMIAGGYAHNIGGLGDTKINSSLGSQWKYKIDDLDYQINEQSKKFKNSELENIYLNIILN